MNRTDVPEKPRRMIRWLREQIAAGELAHGRRLPSIRELMRRFNLSYGSAKRGIDYLCEIGLVEKAVGKGTFVRRARRTSARRSSSAPRITVCTRLEKKSTGIYATVFLGLMDEAAARNCPLQIQHMDLDDVSSRRLAELANGEDGLILLAPYDTGLRKLILPVPAVGVSMHNTFGGHLSIVDIDPVGTARLAADYFDRRNVRTVHVLTSDRPAYHARGEFFAALWSRRTGCRVSFASSFPASSFSAADGYLFVTGASLQTCSEQVHQRTGKLLRDVAPVLGIDGKNTLDPSFHPAPCIKADWRHVGQAALHECLRRIAEPGTPARRIYVAGTLLVE